MKHSKETEAIDTNSSKKEDMLNVGSVPDARKVLDTAPATPDGLPKMTPEEEAAEKRRLANERRHPPGIGTY
jgi:hypothetical protein